MATKNTMRPTTPKTPNVRISHAPRAGGAGPTSPPQTPTTASPLLNRGKLGKPSPKSQHLPPFQNVARPPISPVSNFHPLGNGQFSYTRSRPGQLSPESPSSDEEDEDGDSESSDSSKPPRSSSHGDDTDEEEEQSAVGPYEEEDPGNGFLRPPPNIRITRLATTYSFTIEELSDVDPMESDSERPNVIRPHAFEYPESDRSRSRSRLPPELDRHMMRGMRELNCEPSSSDSDSSDGDGDDVAEDAAHAEFLRKQRELKIRRRRSHGSSFGKRTHSERGESDREDLESVDWNEESSATARRTRRKVGERWSIQFTDNPQATILEEEEILAEEIVDWSAMFKELPYNYMEVDSP